jgi:hypothetical protein
LRWDDLFDDLEGQLEQELRAEERSLDAEEERLRIGRLALRDRIVAVQSAERRHSAYSIRTRLVDGEVLQLRPATVGRDWFAADIVGDVPAAHPQCIVPFAAVASFLLTRAQVARSLAGGPTAEPEQSLPARLTLGFVLRDLCRRRAAVELRLHGSVVRGTIDRVGRDHLDLAVHEAGSPRRESAVTEYCVVPFAQLVLVRT